MSKKGYNLNPLSQESTGMVTGPLVERLRQFQRFNGMQDGTLTEIIGSSRIGGYQKGHFLFYRDSAPQTSYVILSGSAKSTRNNPDGSGLLMPLKAGDWIGLAEAISGYNHFTEAVIRRDSQLLEISKNVINRLLQIPEFMNYVLVETSQYLRRLNDGIAILSCVTAYDKLITFFHLYLKDLSGKSEVEIDLTHEELGLAAGSLTRPTVSNTLLQMRKEGILSQARRGTLILDKGLIEKHYSEMK